MPLLTALRTASQVFSQQAAPPNSSSALQSVFLSNLVAMTEETSRHSEGHNRSDRHGRPRLDHRSSHEADMRRPGDAENMLGLRDVTADESGHGLDRQQDEFEQSEGPPESSQYETFNFFDEEMWSTVFANAGFNINEGVFLPEASGG